MGVAQGGLYTREPETEKKDSASLGMVLLKA